MSKTRSFAGMRFMKIAAGDVYISLLTQLPASVPINGKSLDEPQPRTVTLPRSLARQDI
jgi:hypothetical protein